MDNVHTMHSPKLDSLDFIEVFPWNKNLETGIPEIDAQHKQLVVLLNQLASHIGQQSHSIHLNDVFNQLSAYADYHFQFEEVIWQSCFEGDLAFIEHQQIHRSFTTQVLALKAEEEKKGLTQVVEDILRFLIHWLAHHILDSDKRMAIALQAMKSGLSLDKAKEHADIEMSGSTQVFVETLLSMYDHLSTQALALMREKVKSSHMKQALRESEQRERMFSNSLMDSAPSLIYLYDHKLRLSRWNKKHTELTGYSDEELDHMHVLDFFNPDDHTHILDSIQQAYNKGYIEIEAQLLRKDKTLVPYLLTAVPLDVAGKQYFSGIGIDITDRKQAEEKLEKKRAESKNALLGTISAIAKAVEARDPYTSGHQQRVSDIATAIAQEMHLTEDCIEGIRLGAKIHDIGKLSIPSDILVKPSRLSKLEFLMIQEHPQAAVDILSDIDFPWPVSEIAAQHHERLDGSGYPHGLKGDAICLEARVVSVADVFEAMSSHRPYRASKGKQAALDELLAGQGLRYDTQVVDALLRIVDQLGE